jgi:hypothetical protein
VHERESVKTGFFYGNRYGMLTIGYPRSFQAGLDLASEKGASSAIGSRSGKACDLGVGRVRVCTQLFDF